MVLAATLEEVTAKEITLRKLAIGAVLEPTASFVSVIEVSNYMKTDINHPKVQARLYPHIPRLKYMCFYPMSKRRNLEDNWYMTDRAERGRMMRSHGQIGKKYEETIKEFTTGAVVSMIGNGVLRSCPMMRFSSKKSLTKCVLMK